MLKNRVGFSLSLILHFLEWRFLVSEFLLHFIKRDYRSGDTSGISVVSGQNARTYVVHVAYIPTALCHLFVVDDKAMAFLLKAS